MTLLGGAAKLATAGAAIPAVPAFTGAPYSVVDFVLAPGQACAKLELRSNGEIWAVRCGFPNFLRGRWDNFHGGLTIGDYDFRVDKISGTDLNSDLTQNTWHPGVNLMKFGLEVTNSNVVFVGTIRVRPSGGGADLDSASISIPGLNAESTP